MRGSRFGFQWVLSERRQRESAGLSQRMGGITAKNNLLFLSNHVATLRPRGHAAAFWGVVLIEMEMATAATL